MIKILIADDDGSQLELLNEHIDSRFSREAQVRTAKSGRQAVDLAALWDADILLLRVEIPGIDGLEAAKQILAQRPDCRILFVTAYRSFSCAHEALKLGACGYLLSPVDPGELEFSLRRAMEQARALRQFRSLSPSGILPESSTAGDKTALLMSKVKSYLQHNYMLRDISLDSVSGILNINSSYFSALFKRSFGVNFVEYLTRLRMDAARELLADPLRSTSEVAGMVGYESANYFTRAFKKNTGMTPTEYRARTMVSR